MKADGNSFPESSLGWTIGGSARASRAVSSALAGNTGECVRRGRRTRQPGRLCSPFQRSGVSAERRKLPQEFQMAAFSRKPLRRNGWGQPQTGRTGRARRIPHGQRTLFLNPFWDGRLGQVALERRTINPKSIIATFVATALVAGCSKQVPITLNDRAMAMGLNIVSNSLIAPTTAKFSAVTCQECKDNTFLISGKVDSQNPYGAMLRKDFFCVITNVGAGQLIWLGTTVGGEAQVNPDFFKETNR